MKPPPPRYVHRRKNKEHAECKLLFKKNHLKKPLIKPETQMTLVLVGKGIVFGDWPSKVELIGASGINTLYSFLNANMISMICIHLYNPGIFLVAYTANKRQATLEISLYIGSSLLFVTVNTRTITCLIRDSFKPSFATITGNGDNPIHTRLHGFDFQNYVQYLSLLLDSFFNHLLPLPCKWHCGTFKWYL